MEDYEERVDAHVRAVATRLPFAVELFADVAGPNMLQINLGHRGGSDDAPDSASIDPTFKPATWIIDIEGGRNDIGSTYGLETDPAVVAFWIAEQALQLGCPAAQVDG